MRENIEKQHKHFYSFCVCPKQNVEDSPKGAVLSSEHRIIFSSFSKLSSKHFFQVNEAMKLSCNSPRFPIVRMCMCPVNFTKHLKVESGSSHGGSAG